VVTFDSYNVREGRISIVCAFSTLRYSLLPNLVFQYQADEESLMISPPPPLPRAVGIHSTVFPNICLYLSGRCLHANVALVVSAVLQTQRKGVSQHKQEEAEPGKPRVPYSRPVGIFFADCTRRVRKVKTHHVFADREFFMLIVATLRSTFILNCESCSFDSGRTGFV
jgi:hypothetical protein